MHRQKIQNIILKVISGSKAHAQMCAVRKSVFCIRAKFAAQKSDCRLFLTCLFLWSRQTGANFGNLLSLCSVPSISEEFPKAEIRRKAALWTEENHFFCESEILEVRLGLSYLFAGNALENRRLWCQCICFLFLVWPQERVWWVSFGVNLTNIIPLSAGR